MVSASPRRLPKHEEYVIMEGSDVRWSTVSVYSMPKDRTEPLTLRADSVTMKEGMILASEYESKGHVIELRRESPKKS